MASRWIAPPPASSRPRNDRAVSAPTHFHRVRPSARIRLPSGGRDSVAYNHGLDCHSGMRPGVHDVMARLGAGGLAGGFAPPPRPVNLTKICPFSPAVGSVRTGGRPARRRRHGRGLPGARRALGRDVAIEDAARRRSSRDPERVARFEREARILADAQPSEHRARSTASRTQDGVLALVMELVEGDDARRAPAARRRSPAAACRCRRRCTSRGRSSTRSKPRTRRASSIATSSRRTSSSRRTAR